MVSRSWCLHTFYCNGMISNTEYIRLLSELGIQFSITFPIDPFSMIQHGDLMEKPGVISQRSGPQGDTICTRIYLDSKGDLFIWTSYFPKTQKTSANPTFKSSAPTSESAPKFHLKRGSGIVLNWPQRALHYAE